MKTTTIALFCGLLAALFVVACAPADDTTVVDTDDDGEAGIIERNTIIEDGTPDTVNVYDDNDPDSINVYDSTEPDTTNNYYYGGEDTTTDTTATME
jgi:hypothetical protein